MLKQQTFWIHPASFTCRPDRPEQVLETLWVERQGWGYLRRRDLWIKRDCSLEELQAEGYVLRRPPGEEDVVACPHCGMYMQSIPGSLVHKHVAGCRGGNEDWQKIEEAMITEQRIMAYEAKILADKLREEAELADAERKGRYDKIREGMLTRQAMKDRKKRIKEETKEEWKNR
jgi:hypothetical protein